MKKWFTVNFSKSFQCFLYLFFFDVAEFEIESKNFEFWKFNVTDIGDENDIIYRFYLKFATLKYGRCFREFLHFSISKLVIQCPDIRPIFAFVLLNSS